MRLGPLGARVLAAMLVAASPVSAGGVNLAWQNCASEGGTSNHSFACASNIGTHFLTSSFVLNSDLSSVMGNELILDLRSQSDPIPQWWEFRDPGTCRMTSLSFDTAVSGANTLCTDWASGRSTGGIGYYGTQLGTLPPGVASQHRRLRVALAVPVTDVVNLFANVEYFSCNVVIDNAKTVGAGSCGGCGTPVCIVLNSLNVTTSVPANSVRLETPTASSSNLVTWQGVGPDCLILPTRATTWGAVKSLYR